MATSDSTNFTVNRDDVITEALQLIGVVEEGGTASTNQLSDCSRTLNMMVKNWMSDGLQLWLNEEVVIFAVKGQATLTFGASGDRMARSSGVVTTKLNGDHTSGSTSLTIDSGTGMSTSDIIGVVTNTAGIHWTTISGSPGATTVSLTSGLSAAASDNDRVYTYTTVFAQKVAQIQNAWVRTNEDVDIPIDIISRQEYVDLSSKTQAGRVNQIYFDPQRDTSIASTWPVPDDSFTNDRIYTYVTRYLEDFDAASDDADFPQEWYFPLAYNLAMYVGPKYGVTGGRLAEIAQLATRLKDSVEDWDTEDQSIFVVPGDSQGTYRR